MRMPYATDDPNDLPCDPSCRSSRATGALELHPIATALASCATRDRNPRAPCAGAGDATAEANRGRWNGPTTMSTTRWMTYQDLPWANADSGTCRVCGCEKEEGDRWQTFCKKNGGACLEWYKIRSDPQHARRAVYGRDRGVCALCGLDVPALRKELQALAEARKDGDTCFPEFTLLERHGFKPYRFSSLWEHARWEADHIVPVAEGGGMCGLEGLRTLCLPCHHKETAALAARLAERRHADRRPGHFLD